MGEFFWGTNLIQSYLKTAFSTDVEEMMAKRTACRGGLVSSVKCTAFLTTMTTTGITAVRLTEIKPVLMDGLARIARCSVFPEMTKEGITRATRKVTKCA